MSKNKANLTIAGTIIGVIILYLAVFVGLGPVRRIGQVIVPDPLRNKVTVNSVCADKNRIYVFQGDNGNFQTQIIIDGCKDVPPEVPAK